jgi:hypothetical protein
VLQVFVDIRGLDALLQSGTAVVLRKGYEAYVIQDASEIDHRGSILALVHVKDMACYDRLLAIQTNHFYQRRKLDRTLAHDLAGEITTRLLSQTS